MLVRDLRSKNNKELLNLVEDFKAQLFMLRFQNKTGQLDKPHKISQVKKDIAKVFTILNARELKFEQVNAKVTKKVVESNNQESKLKKDEEVKSSKQISQKNVKKKIPKLESKQLEKKVIKKEDK